MEEQKYLVVVNDIEIVGRQMTLEYALMITKSIFEHYYADTDIRVEIRRERGEQDEQTAD